MADARSQITTGRGRNSLSNLRSKQKTLPSALSRAKGTAGGAYDAPKQEGLARPKAQGTEDLNVTSGLQKIAAARKTTVGDSARPNLATPKVDFSQGTQAWNAATTSINQNIMSSALAAQAVASRMQQTGGPQVGPGPGGPIMKQLAAGFAAAGDQKMARFIRRRPELMREWLSAEGLHGQDASTVSAYYPGHGKNYGAFQFARLGKGTRPWLEKYIKRGKFTMTPYQQAVMAEKQFGLSPADVKRYVDQIRGGSYEGWPD